MTSVVRTDAYELREAHVGTMDNVAYLLTCRRTGAQLLVDAAADATQLMHLVQEASPQPRLDLVVTTHRHADHVGALEDVVAATGASTAAGALDADHLPVAVDRLLEDGDVIEVGDLRLLVRHLRGHTPGSVALVLRGTPDRVFTGDSLFPGGPGKTTNPEDFTSLMDDLEQRVFGALPDETVVHPGHGRATELGAERPHLAQWRSRGW